MVFNPLFIQNSSNRDSAILGKASGLKGKGYLFSDMMQVCLGSQTGSTAKFEQFLSSNTKINADETNSNLFKLTEGNISSENEVKFELLLQFLGVTSKDLPEQTGLSLEIPNVSSEELQSMLAKITSNTDNESELNKVIDEKLLKSAEDNEENLLVTLQFNNKTIAIDIVPCATVASKTGSNGKETGEISTTTNTDAAFNMTVSILPSDVSENIISKFIESTHLLKKEAEGTARVSTQENTNFKLVQNNDQTNLAEVKNKAQIDDLVSKAIETAPDLAKKITIYSVANEVDTNENNVTKPNIETTFTNPLKQIKFNNQTAGLSSTANSKTINLKIDEPVSKPTTKSGTEIPKAGTSNISNNNVNSTGTIDPSKVIDTKVDPNEQPVDETKNIKFTGSVIKESGEANNFTKPAFETFVKENKAISSSNGKTGIKESLNSQELNNLINDSEKKTETQNKASIKIDNNQQTVKNGEQTVTSNIKAQNGTELEIPSSEKVTISIKKESTIKIETPSVKQETSKEAKLASELNPSIEKEKVETSPVKNEVINTKNLTEKTIQNFDEAKQSANTFDDSNKIKDKNDNAELLKDFEKTLKNTENKNSEAKSDVNLPIESKEKADKDPVVKVGDENNTSSDKEIKAKVNNLVENAVTKESNAKEKTNEIIKESPVKDNEVVKTKTEAEPEKPVNQTTSKESEVLREISGTNNTSSEHKSSQHGDTQTNHFVHSTHGVENASNNTKATFDEAMANNQAHKVVKQSEVVKEVHQFVERKDSNQLVLKVEPADLGKVKVTLEIVDKVVKVNVEVESEVIKQSLEKSMNDLSQQLNKSGLQLGSVNISLQNADKGNKHNQPNKKKFNNKIEGGDIVENETGETKAGKSLGYNTYDYVV